MILLGQQFGRTALLAIACAACRTPMTPPLSDAAPSSFTFTAYYILDSTITTAQVGSASYASGQTIHVDLDFASYSAAAASALEVTLVSGSDSGSFVITPSCPPSCTNASGEMLTASVSWQGEPIVTDEDGSCDSPGNACGWAE